MQGLIDCGKYKVTEVLSSHSGLKRRSALMSR